VVQTWSR